MNTRSKYFETNFKKELPAISELEQLFEQDNANQQAEESTASTTTEEKPAQDSETKQTVPREVTPESGEKLSETKKAAVTVTGDEFGEYTDIKDLRKKAIQYYKEHLQGTSVENKILGKIDIDENGLVEFTAAGRKKVESTSAQEQKLLLVKHLPQLIRDATEIQKADAIKERHKDDIFYYMKNHAVINGKQIPIHITLIKHNTGRIQFYNHAIEMENAPVNSAEPVSSNEALGFPPVGAFSNETISQDSRDDKANLKPHHPTREETKPESKSAEKETDEQSAIEELKAKTKAELEEILETDKYPSIQEYLDDSFKNLEYESLEAAQRGRNAVLKDARKMKAENRVAKFAAVRLHRNWVDKVTVADSYDRTLDKKMQSILDKMRDGKITGEEAYEKLDDLLSGRAQKKAKAKRAGKQEKRNQLIQKLKDDLAQILDLDNHPNLKEYLYRGIDLELQKLEAESLKRLKEWCDSQITEAKGIRDKGKIEEWEERAKERLPKPQPKPQSDTQKTTPAGKADITGTPNIDTSNVVAEKDLTPAQKLLVSFGKKLGVEVVFFYNEDSNFRGVHKEGKTFLNINGNKELGGVFWHESLHWLRNNNQKLYQELVKAAGITDAQRQAYLEESERTDLETDEAIDEEILANAMDDVAKRTGLFQSIAGKNRGLIERVIQWFKDTLNKFIDHFRNPQGKLTTKQAQALADEFGRIANQLKDPNGNQIFRYNRRTHNVELADGRDLSDTSIAIMTLRNTQRGTKLSFAETKKATTEDDTLSSKEAVKQKLLPLVGKPITNKATGIVAFINIKQINEMLSNRAVNKSKNNGFSQAQHLEATENIKQLYEDASLTLTRPDKKKTPDSQGLKSVKIFHCKTNVSGDNAIAKLTVKESFQHGHRVYSIELEELNKPTELKNRTGTDSSAGSESSTQKGNMSSSRYADEPSTETIPQDSRADKPKFSIGADNESNFFRRAWNKFAKAVGLDGDRIVTEEDRRRDKLQAQEKAMAAYLKEPTNKNMQVLKQLGVTKGQLEAYMNGEEYAPEIGLIQNYRGSPSRIADKNAVFRAFFNMGDRAMDKLVRLRDDFSRHYGEAMALVKNQEDREQLVQLLWDGDEEQKEFTKEELLQDGVKENVADAYLAIRRQMRRAYTLLDEARRRPQSYAKHMDNDELKRLRDNKFVKQGTLKVHDKKDDKGNHLVTWTEYANQERTYTVDGSAHARFLADDAIQILEEKELPDGTYKVTVREGIPKLTDREGYVPHFFHEFHVTVRDADGKQVGDIIGTGRTQREAIKLAEEWQKNNTLKNGEQIHITPHTFNFGMGEDNLKKWEKNYAPIMGDKDFEVMMNRIAKNTGTTLAEAQQIVKGAVKLKNRHRFLGQLLQRKGYAGYEKDMDWVLRHHFNTVARYVALETEFKPKAISLFERVFGAFDKDYSKNLLAKYTKDYINDVNGVPVWIDDGLNKLIQSIPVVGREIFYPAFGKQGVQRLTYDIAGTVAALKLGMFSISSAVINFTQLINSAGYVGWTPLMRHFRSVVSRKGKLTMGETRILHESGILQDIGLDTPDGYDKNRMDNLLAKSMIIFQKCDSLCRISTGLAAFEKATNEGKNRAEALAYAKKVNRDANFSYGIEDAPNLMRRTGSIGKLALQFYKYPFKELEVMADFLPLPQNKKTTWKQKAVFWAPYLLVCGLTGIIPFFDWGDDWLNKHFGLFPKDFMQRTIMELFNGSEFSRMIGKVIMYGAPALANIDVSKRTGLASFATPDSLFGAAGDTVWGVGENVLQGNFPNALRSLSPGLFNIYMAAVGGETHNARGRKLSAYEDAYARLIRGLGFTSVDESVERDINRISFNAQSERTKLEQRAIDAYIADETAENRKRLEELGISAKRVKDERRKKKLGIIERRQENIPKKRRRDYEELFKFAQ